MDDGSNDNSLKEIKRVFDKENNAEVIGYVFRLKGRMANVDQSSADQISSRDPGTETQRDQKNMDPNLN